MGVGEFVTALDDVADVVCDISKYVHELGVSNFLFYCLVRVVLLVLLLLSPLHELRSRLVLTLPTTVHRHVSFGSTLLTRERPSIL